MIDLLSPLRQPCEHIRPGLVRLAGFADTAALHADVERVAAAAPFRRLTTPGGRTMAVAMTNCGPLGWVSDRGGYRYEPDDPMTGRPWPAMPALFTDLAARAAAAAGHGPFAPDACLVNRYEPGTGLGSHQDRDEADFAWPIVSVSIGLPAVFAWFGDTRGGRPIEIRLEDGDVVVFGGPARRGFHGVRPLKPGLHPLTGAARINLTFRRARP